MQTVEELFNEIYDKFKINFYKIIFKKFEKRNPSLSLMEVFCVDIIYALNRPTISQLTEFMGASQPNTAYRITSLVKKGYVRKIQSEDDKREYYLELTDKYYKYNDIKKRYVDLVINRLKEKLTVEEMNTFQGILKQITSELMPEVTYIRQEKNQKDDNTSMIA
jgi:transcriptional regulator, MarR family